MIKKTSLKLFTFRTLKILWFNRFRRKKTYLYVLSNPFQYFVLFCSLFNCYFDFSKQHFNKPDNNEKKKPQPQIQNHPLPPSKDMPTFPRNENIKLQLACELALYFGRVAKSQARTARVRRRQCGGRGERRVLSRLALLEINEELSSMLNFNSCRAHYSFL